MKALVKKPIVIIIAAVLVLLIAAAIVFFTVGNPFAPATSKRIALKLAYDNVRFPEFKDNMVLKKLGDELDVVYNYYDDPGLQLVDQIISRVASGNLPDRITDGVPLNILNQWIEQGIIIPLDPNIIKENAPKYWEWIHKWIEDPFKFGYRNGVNYWQPVVWTLGLNAKTVGIRNDWLTNVGLSEPKTLDEFEAILDAFTNKDPEKTGKKDTYALTASSEGSTTGVDKQYYVASIVWGAYGVYPSCFYEEGGKMVFGDVQPGAKDALTTLNRWYNAGYIDPEWMANKPDNVIEKMVSGKVGMCEADWFYFIPQEAFWSGKYYEGLKGKNPDISFTIIGPVSGPGGAGGILQANPDRGGIVYTSNLKNDQPKLIKYLKHYDLISFNLDWMSFVRWGTAGVHYNYDSEKGRVWIPPFDNQPERDKLGIGIIGGTNFNDYELQKKFMTQPRYLDLRASIEYKSTGKYDLVQPIQRPVYSKITADHWTYVQTNVINFITGKRPISEFDDFVKGWYDMGGTEIMKEAQEAYDKYYKK